MNISAIVRVLPPFFRRRKLVTFLLTLFPGSNIQLVEVEHGGKLYADVSDRFPKTYFVTGSYNPEFFKIVSFFLKDGSDYLDAGANFGFCSFGFMGFPGGTGVRYHLFEASREICGVLEKSKALWPAVKIEINHACVTDSPGVSKLFIKKGHLSGSFISEDGTQSVPNLTLDGYVRDRGIQQVDFLKLDVEGYEYPALKGASTSLGSGLIKAIFMEASEPNMEQRSWKVSDCLDFLRQRSYRLFYVWPADFKFAGEAPAVELRAGSRLLKVMPLEQFPAGHQTDILAIHESADCLKS